MALQSNSAYTSVSGRFEFNRLAPGTYTVVATSGLQQASERVDANNFSNTGKHSHAGRGQAHGWS